MELRIGLRLRLLFLCAVALISAAAQGETYIVPLWATTLHGQDGTWWVQATVTNPGDFPVSFHVSRVFPLQTAACASCTGASPAITLEPHASRVIQPPSGSEGLRLVAGAFEVTSSGPVTIHLVAYRPGSMEIRQRLDVARRWLDPGSHAIHAVERGSGAWRMNVFVTNPGTTALEVTARVRAGDQNEVHGTIAPGTTSVLRLPAPTCGGVPCPVPTAFPPLALTVDVEGTGEFLASVSSVDADWAVFVIAGEALQ